ncbi:MAG TPA: UPF0182 family protein [Terriglobales bacterium]|nr:UPF0182 family protein [Terriglobales bacterium]
MPRPSARPRTRRFRLTLVIVIVLLLIGARTIASTVIDYQWWKELGQVDTWLNLYLYAVTPLAAATILAFAALWVAHARALKFAGTALGEHPTYAKLSSLALLAVGFVVSAASLDTWTVVRYLGSRHLPAGATAWHDAVFDLPLSFYLFDLPFYSDLRGYVLALIVVSILVYWIAARIWQLQYRISELREMREIDPGIFRLEGGLESKFLRGALVVALFALAFRFFLGRYEMVLNQHNFLVGVDYVDDHIGLPLQWLLVAASLLAAIFVWAGRWLLAALMALALVVRFVVPGVVSALHVRPNEISLERLYIERHIHSTRSAFGIEKSANEIEFKVNPNASIDPNRHRNLLDNVRLWDWHPFHDTVSQTQALRSYYVFEDTDVDRYTIGGNYRQVLLSPRELDIRQLSGTQTSWINSHFIYTHGYGIVLADVSKIRPDGLPVFLIQNMPPEVTAPGLKLTRPEIYYGEMVHEPVFLDTRQPEFDYPSGADNVHSVYKGKGGFPIASFGMRLAAAVQQGDFNILLTNYLTDRSRMMIRRKIRQRLETLAGFLEWDTDPYLVITEDGRLLWIVDGYTTSNAHPYSRSVEVAGVGSVNYIRNAVKATIDAYDGTTNLYIFAPSDPIIQAYAHLFKSLFHPASEMPPAVRAHARYPEILFRVQAEIYRTYHMLDPQAFYNKEDVWDIASFVSGQNGTREPMTPTYVVASLPSRDRTEFMLILPFTPRTKDNLIGLMVGRCDGENLGELTVLQLSKQELIRGPMQIDAMINQDQNISKDLTLWNQQGSQVLRGQTLVLPASDTFLYVEPVYIQATQARMPQLKKVVLVVGDRLIYTDTYEQALAELGGGRPAVEAAQKGAAAATPSAAGATPAAGDRRLESIRNHLRRYRELAGQGRWVEAGKELEAIDSELK